MKMSFEDEKSLLQQNLKKLFEMAGDTASEQRSAFLVKRMINVANFASRQEDQTARLQAKGFLNSIRLSGDFVWVSIGIKSGVKKVSAEETCEEQEDHQFYDCVVMKPRLKAWLRRCHESGANPLEKVLVSFELVNPRSEAVIFEGKPKIERKAILESIEIR